MTSSAARTSDDDLFVLTIMGFLALGGAAGSAPLWWAKALSWLLAHRVLVPSAEHPLFTLPRSGGAGVDVPRLAVFAAAVLLLLAAVIGAFRRHVRAGELR